MRLPASSNGHARQRSSRLCPPRVSRRHRHQPPISTTAAPLKTPRPWPPTKAPALPSFSNARTTRSPSTRWWSQQGRLVRIDGELSMQAFRIVLAVLAFTIIAFLLCAAQGQPAAAASSAQQQSPASIGSPPRTPTVPPATTRKVTEYTLPPDLYKKARDSNRIYFRLRLIGFVYGLIGEEAFELDASVLRC